MRKSPIKHAVHPHMRTSKKGRKSSVLPYVRGSGSMLKPKLANANISKRSLKMLYKIREDKVKDDEHGTWSDSEIYYGNDGLVYRKTPAGYIHLDTEGEMSGYTLKPEGMFAPTEWDAEKKKHVTRYGYFHCPRCAGLISKSFLKHTKFQCPTCYSTLKPLPEGVKY